MPLVSVLQLDADPDPAADRLGRLEAALDEAAAAGAVLLVAPELATTGYGDAQRIAAEAEGPGGPVLARLQAAVDRAGAALVVGLPLAAPGGGVLNGAAILRPGLSPVLYGKAQLYGDYERAIFAIAPVETVIAEVAGLRVGVLVCFDVEFPEHVRRLALAGADLVAVPTAVPDQPGSPFVTDRLVPVRAFENQIFVAYADWAGRDARFAYAGRSCLVAPDGADLLRAPAAGRFLGTAAVDPAAYDGSRVINPYLADLRTPDR